MADAKFFSNVILGQYVLSGAPVQVYVDGRYLTITDPDDIEDQLFGFGIDADGETHEFDYRLIQQIKIGENIIDLQTYNEAMQKLMEPSEEEKEDAPAEDESEEDAGDEEPAAEEEEAPAEEPPAEDEPKAESYTPNGTAFRRRMYEMSRDELKAQEKSYEADIEAAEAKEKSAKEKLKTLKRQPIEDSVDLDLDRDANDISAPYIYKAGDVVKNINPTCKHFGSKGIVKRVTDIPNDIGTLVSYTTTNSGDTFKIGELLTKTIDQLEPVR